MIMKYEWQHLWKTWEIKLKTMFGESEPPNEDIVVTDEGYTWEPGDAINRLDEPSFIENVNKL